MGHGGIWVEKRCSRHVFDQTDCSELEVFEKNFFLFCTLLLKSQFSFLLDQLQPFNSIIVKMHFYNTICKKGLK